MCRIIVRVLLFGYFAICAAERVETVYQKLKNDQEFSQFNDYLKRDHQVQSSLLYGSLTIFVPENGAVVGFGGRINPSYHITPEVVTIGTLTAWTHVNVTNDKHPPLWITKRDGELFVNNAKILIERSNYVAKTVSGTFGKEQVLHVIDDVLDPVNHDPEYAPTAFHFLQSPQKWELNPRIVSNFFHKVQENKLQNEYKDFGTNTYFIPIDQGIDSYKYSMLDKHIIQGHIIQNIVLFTRPTEKNFIFESKANGDYIYIVLSFEVHQNKTFIKSCTILGDSTHQKGEILAEIVKPNIPVKNGVVHLISRPLGVFDRVLKPFPYLPILNKISSDPNLDFTFLMGRRTGFNTALANLNKSLAYTYFVATDESWKNMRSNNLILAEEEVDMLKNNLVVAETAYSVEKLLSLSKAHNYTDFTLETLGEPLAMTVLHMVDGYYIRWHHKYIKIQRSNYECTDGIIHILDVPLGRFKKYEEIETEPPTFWEKVKRIFS